jgi:hypothetical protein
MSVFSERFSALAQERNYAEFGEPATVTRSGITTAITVIPAGQSDLDASDDSLIAQTQIDLIFRASEWVPAVGDVFKWREKTAQVVSLNAISAMPSSGEYRLSAAQWSRV